jgi:cysteine rich repeat protein
MVQRMISATGRDLITTFSRPTAAFVRATLVAACLVGLLVLSLSRAGAQDGRSEARQACSADYHRLCAGVSPGGGRIRKCLNDNFDSLSEPCKQAVSARSGK